MANLRHLPLFCLLAAAVLIADGEPNGASSRPIADCRVDPSQITICRPAVTGEDPPHPTTDCCTVVKQSNLPCLCKFKNFLPVFGIDPPRALALPKKCGLKTPPECKSN